ncbi:MAG: AraC family ligand binding domain-containing protein [Ruminococcus sp.]|nr:AraC family ligand binding domain-containing protein [Ruminococcus sp.]
MSEMVFYKGEQMEFVIVRGGKLAFDEHCHASDIVISGITDGCALLTLGGAVRKLGEGDIFSVLPYENHSLKSQLPVGMLTMCIKKRPFLAGKG